MEWDFLVKLRLRPIFKSRSGYTYPPPPPCVYQYLMNIIQLQCNFSAVVTKKMFISVHIYRVFITLGSIQVQKKLFKQMFRANIHFGGLFINQFSIEPWHDSQVLLPMDPEYENDQLTNPGHHWPLFCVHWSCMTFYGHLPHFLGQVAFWFLRHVMKIHTA